MIDMQLDALIDMAVTEAEILRGTPASVSAARSSYGARGQVVLRRGRSGPIQTRSTAARWSPEELNYFHDRLGKVSEAEIGAALGRTVVALNIIRKRKGWPAPTKMPDELTAHRCGLLIGKDPKCITRLIDLGILPGRVLPKGRNIHVVKRVTLARWLITPRNWVYYRAANIRDPHLRRLVLLAQSRWPDRWLTTGEAAAIMGTDHRNVNQWIHRGRLPAVHWNNWYVLESVARRTTIPHGKGFGHEIHVWSDHGDAFLLLARAGRVPWTVMARLMRGPYTIRRLPYRLKQLHRTGKIPGLIARHQLPVVYNPATGALAPGPGFRPRWRLK